MVFHSPDRDVIFIEKPNQAAQSPFRDDISRLRQKSEFYIVPTGLVFFQFVLAINISSLTGLSIILFQN